MAVVLLRGTWHLKGARDEERRDLASSRRSSRAIPRRPSSSCLWSTTSCASWPPSRLAQEKPGQTLQATALVHEAYLRLVGTEQSPAVEQPRPFLRRGGRGDAAHPGRIGPATSDASKRGGGQQRVDLDQAELSLRRQGSGRPRPRRGARPGSSREEPECAELVKLRFFAGLTQEEAAQALGVTRRTADRYWAYARAWLFHALMKGRTKSAE